MKILTKANSILKEFTGLVDSNSISNHKSKNLKVGIDLGTSSIVLSVVNDKGKPIYGAYQTSDSIRDGLVVDYVKSVEITKQLKLQAEEKLGRTLEYAAAAVPPGTVGNNKNVVGHILESAGFEVTSILDEPTAASKLLGLENGVVIDVGGGTTGISIIKNGKVIYVTDEATGGTHMNLVISGARGLSVQDAEAYKKDAVNQAEVFSLIRPVVEKMATISKQALETGGYEPGMPIVVVGGATNFDEFESTFSKCLGKPVFKPLHPEFVTPLGIAIGSEI